MFERVCDARFFEPVYPPRSFQVMAHRGERRQAPENTRPALERLVSDFIEWAEVDVRLTRDGHHVISHDRTVDRVTNGHGLVSMLTLGQIKRLDAGSWFAKRYAGERMLSLPECLALAKGKLNLCLDCKEVAPDALAREILAAGMENQVVVFGDEDTLYSIRTASRGRIPIMAKWRPGVGKKDWVNGVRPRAVEIDADDVTPDICAWFHSKGIKVEAKALGEADAPARWDEVLAAGADWIQTDYPENVIAHRLWKRVRTRPVLISCHRGAKWFAPENTAPAFEKAIRLGVDYVEFDIRPSKDGKFFIMHDRKLNRTTNGDGPINECPSETIRALDAGSWFGKPFAGVSVPTLDETMRILKGRAKLYIDAKDIPAETLAEKLKQCGLVDQCVVYDDPPYLAHLKKLLPKVRLLSPIDSPDQIQTLVDKLHPYAFDADWDSLSKAFIDRCHAKGARVFSDSMGDENIQRYQQAMRWGIDLIQTDHPLRVFRAIELQMKW